MFGVVEGKNSSTSVHHSEQFPAPHVASFAHVLQSAMIQANLHKLCPMEVFCWQSDFCLGSPVRLVHLPIPELSCSDFSYQEKNENASLNAKSRQWEYIDSCSKFLSDKGKGGKNPNPHSHRWGGSAVHTWRSGSAVNTEIRSGWRWGEVGWGTANEVHFD